MAFITKKDALNEHMRLVKLKEFRGGLLNADTQDGITVISQQWHPDHAPTMEEVLKRPSLLPRAKEVIQRKTELRSIERFRWRK